MKILDCTLRDGGYYTNWDFSQDLVDTYCAAMESLPVDYIEIGYRSIQLEGYLGEYFYCPVYLMKDLKEKLPSKKLVVILNEKDIRPEHVPELLGPCIPYLSMIRIAVDPKNFERAILLAGAVKALGFEVAFNVMYMSNWKEETAFLDSLGGIGDTIDYFYMVDSFGGVSQDDVEEIVALIKSKTNVPLGFHGHNNLEMALTNTIKAIDLGCDIVDATITGMGRGAGNLKTELLLTYLTKIGKIEFDYGKLASSVSLFEELKEHYKWGTNLPYMFSGAFSLPQKEVMEWIGMNRYPIKTIINALNNKKETVEDNVKLPKVPINEAVKTLVILGGGESVKNIVKPLIQLLENNENVVLAHTGLKFIEAFKNISNKQYYCLSGYESDELMDIFDNVDLTSKLLVYPPYPRKMGTIIPQKLIKESHEIGNITFTSVSKDSPLSVAIQLGIDFQVESFHFVGFDGYQIDINQSQFKLAQENQEIFSDLLKTVDSEVCSLTPTKYNYLKQTSIYCIVD